MLDCEYEAFIEYCQTATHELIPKAKRITCEGYKGLSKEEKTKAMHMKRLEKAAGTSKKLKL